MNPGPPHLPWLPRWAYGLAAVCAALLLPVLFFWVHSHFRHDHVVLGHNAAGDEWAVDARDGELRVGWWRTIYPSPFDARLAASAGGPAPKPFHLYEGTTNYFVSVATPLWALPLLCLFEWAARRQRRIDTGQVCGRCGYNLRASAGRCPECGAEPTRRLPPP